MEKMTALHNNVRGYDEEKSYPVFKK